MEINTNNIKLNNFTAELPEELDTKLRTLVTVEAQIYATEMRDNQDGTFDRVYKAKVNGSTIVKQGDQAPILAKSKRSTSQKIRMAFWHINPDDEFYERNMNKIQANLEDVIIFLEDK